MGISSFIPFVWLIPLVVDGLEFAGLAAPVRDTLFIKAMVPVGGATDITPGL